MNTVKRCRVKNVRGVGRERYVVVLQDGEEVDWEAWLQIRREEIADEERKHGKQ